MHTEDEWFLDLTFFLIVLVTFPFYGIMQTESAENPPLPAKVIQNGWCGVKCH